MRTRNTFLHSFLLAVLCGLMLLYSTPVRAQSAAPAPASTGQPPPAQTSGGAAPTWYNTFYGTIAAAVIMHGWGEVDVEGAGEEQDMENEALGGVHLTGYYVMSPDFHIGGFLTYNEGDHEFDDSDWDVDFETLGIGLTLKYSRPFGSRVRLGGSFDFGYANFQDDEAGVDVEGHGIYMAPRFSFDLLGLQFGSVKVGAHASLGLEVIPYATGEIDRGGNLADVDFDVWVVRLMLLLGLTIGS